MGRVAKCRVRVLKIFSGFGWVFWGLKIFFRIRVSKKPSGQVLGFWGTRPITNEM